MSPEYCMLLIYFVHTHIYTFVYLVSLVGGTSLVLSHLKVGGLCHKALVPWSIQEYGEAHLQVGFHENQKVDRHREV